ncbi:MAG: S8 family peptidase [Pseudarthrobacter sp.]
MTDGIELPESDPNKRESASFTPEVLDRSPIAIPLLRILEQKRHEEELALTNGRDYVPDLLHVIVDLNLGYRGGRDKARQRFAKLLEEAKDQARDKSLKQGVVTAKTHRQYVFARLEPAVIRELVSLDRAGDVRGEEEKSSGQAIYRIWPDFAIDALTTRSVSTVKADAARVSFSAYGEDIVWAVLDSGIDGSHRHFARYKNLKVVSPLRHRDFTGSGSALKDGFGHGTHVAGIIAGSLTADATPGKKIVAVTHHRDEYGEVKADRQELDQISGMAPKCRLVSLKVLDDNGQGEASSLLAAIDEIQRVNGFGRNLRIHGVNLSVGYGFEPEWFACGQSPVCVEVDLLVRSGVVVVVAAGNTGYGYNRTAYGGPPAAGLDVTINDPGNAELAITVGSTHRERPHIYGVSYFSSKGPTGDGRMKPDLVAPGEKILSCGAGKALGKAQNEEKDCQYLEDSGTSMAAPHVSGVIAAFLSVRREYIGKSEEVKNIFLASATDLKRDPHFQGHGLVDLMRAIQSV